MIELRGNRSKLSAAELEARRAEEVHAAPAPATSPPKDLTDPVARACWEAHAPELDRLGLFTRLDLASFRLLCETYALAIYSLRSLLPRRTDGEPDGRRRGYEVIARDGEHGGTPKRAPGVGNFNMLVNTYRSLCSDFGLTPLSRVNLRPGTAGAGPSSSTAGDDDLFDFGT